MLRWVRGKVSGPRNRYIDESSNLDLDLTYVTPQVIAMGLPSSGVESLYRTPITEVSRFLDEQHFGRYLVFNVSEREYDCRHFHNRVVMAPFPDHEPPPLRLIWHLAHAAEAWLAVDKRNVIVVHCVAGKGRTGVLVSCYLALAASRRAASAYAAGEGGAAAPPAPEELAATMMDLFRSVRGDGVRHRSQQRYVRYFCALAAAQYGGGDGGRGRADAAVDTGAAADIAAPPVAAAGDSGKDGDDGDGGAAAASHRRERSIAVVECAAWAPAAEEPSCAPPFAWLPPGLSQVDVNGREVRVVSVKAAAAGEALQWMFRVRNADRSKDESKHEIVFAASFEPAGREGSAAVDIVVAHARVRGRGRFTAPCAGALVLRFDNSAAWRGVKSVLLALSPDPYLRSLRRRASLACDEFGPDEEEEGVEAGGGGGAFDPRPAVATVNLPAALPTPSPTPSPAAVPAAGSAAASASARSSTGSAAAATPPPPTKEEELLALHRWRRVVERGPSAAVAPLPPLLRRSTRVYPHPAADIDAPPRLRLHRLVVSGLHVDPTLPLPVAGEVVQQIAPLVCHLEAIPHTGASEKISTTPAAAPTTLLASSAWTQDVDAAAGVLAFDIKRAQIVGDAVLRFYSGATGDALFHFTVHSAFLLAEGGRPDEHRRFARLVQSVDIDVGKKLPSAAMFDAPGFAVKLELELDADADDAECVGKKEEVAEGKEGEAAEERPPPPPLLTGIMECPDWRGAWQERYIVLSAGRLRCFTHRSAVLPLFSLDVAREFTSAADGFDECRFNVLVPRRRGPSVVSPSAADRAQSYAFQMRSELEQRQWVAAIARERISQRSVERR